MKIYTDERCLEYHQTGHPERPERVRATLALLRAQTELPVEWGAPGPVESAELLRAHTPAHLDRVRKPEGDFDGDTPAYPGIAGHAERAVGAALSAARCAQAGEFAFSLMRPPGHHATANHAMGFCFLNSIAVAALAVQATSKRVAVFDFDVHHGNGTEAILSGKTDVFFSSVHQHPCYPGTGTEDVGRNCFNFPVRPHLPRLEYRAVLTKALARVLKEAPQMIGVSAGFDAYARDPLAQETLELEDFHWLGSQLRKTGVPFFAVLEGGYSRDLPRLIEAFLKGCVGK